MKVKSLSHVQLFATPRIAAHQAPPSMGFSRQEYWSGVPLPSPIVLKIVSIFKIFYFFDAIVNEMIFLNFIFGLFITRI